MWVRHGADWAHLKDNISRFDSYPNDNDTQKQPPHKRFFLCSFFSVKHACTFQKQPKNAASAYKRPRPIFLPSNFEPTKQRISPRTKILIV